MGEIFPVGMEKGALLFLSWPYLCDAEADGHWPVGAAGGQYAHAAAVEPWNTDLGVLGRPVALQKKRRRRKWSGV